MTKVSRDLAYQVIDGVVDARMNAGRERVQGGYFEHSLVATLSIG